MTFFENEGGTGPERRDADRWELLVRRIMAAAAPELERLRNRVTLMGQIDRWNRSLLPMAAVLVLLFGSVLAWPGGEAEAEPADDLLIAEVLVPEPFARWYQTGADYTLAEMVEALEERER